MQNFQIEDFRVKHETNVGVELLRVVLMFLIVFGHCCFFGAFKGETSVVVALTIPFFSVDAFAFISGWYSIRTSPKRFLRFLGIGLLWTVVIWLFGGGFNMTLGWYGNSYLVVMLLAPYINGGIDAMYEKSGKKAILVSCSIVLMFTWLLWLPLGLMNINVTPAGWGTKTSLTLLVMYILGRTLSKIESIKRIRTIYLILGFVALDVFCIGWSALGRIYGGVVSEMKMWTENSPASILAATLFFLIFERLQVPKKFHRAIKLVAPSMFSIYLLHAGPGRSLFEPLYQELETRSLLIIDNHVMSCFISAIVVFVICLLADMLRRISLYVIKNRSCCAIR